MIEYGHTYGTNEPPFQDPEISIDCCVKRNLLLSSFAASDRYRPGWSRWSGVKSHLYCVALYNSPVTNNRFVSVL